MASLNVIENHLDCDFTNRNLRNGRKKWNKNQYYIFDEYYVVMLTRDKYMIVDRTTSVRRLLRKYCWHTSDGYGRTTTENGTKKYHQLFLHYEHGLVADHINNCKFDNRFEKIPIWSPPIFFQILD